MSRRGKSERGSQMLQRIAALLFALAAVVERAAPMPRAMRLSMLIILTPVAAIARRAIVSTAYDFGFHADFSDFDDNHHGGGDRLMRLAYRFAELATTLSELLATVECYASAARQPALEQILQRIETPVIAALLAAARLPDLNPAFPDTS